MKIPREGSQPFESTQRTCPALNYLLSKYVLSPYNVEDTKDKADPCVVLMQIPLPAATELCPAS